MTAVLAIDEPSLATVRSILREHLPDGVSVGVFGSRSTNRFKPWSDLDLVLEAAEPLPLSLLAALAEAFDEGALAWKVDLVDRRAVSDGFGAIIDRTKVALAV